MDIRVLRYFLTVAREESFSRAADALYLSQPTLSRQIREMEEELGTQLLVRTNRSVRLTPAGERVVPILERIVDCYRDLYSAAGEASSGLTPLRLGVLRNMLPPMVFSRICVGW